MFQPADRSTRPGQLGAGPQWLSPIEFTDGGISGGEQLPPFLDHAAKLIVGLSEAGPTWWVERAVAQQLGHEPLVGERVDLRTVSCARSGHINLRFRGELPAELLIVARRFGFEHLEGGVFERRESTPSNVFERELPVARESHGGGLSVPLIPIPDRFDPRIYRPDIGTHTAYSGSVEMWRERMEWEGRSDADSVRRYLEAYNRFIREPSSETLLAATANPSTGTDSYFLGMMYLRDVFQLGAQAVARPGSPERAIFDLLGLLHVTILTHYAADAAVQRGVVGADEIRRGDMCLWEALADSFAATYRR